MRILMLTQWFYPEPDLKGLPLARELVKAGHSVEVITGFPNYPGGKLYEGYHIRFLQKELIEGVSVIRVPLYPSHDKSSIRRIINYTSFAISATILALLFAKKADVIYVYHPPATVGLPAVILKYIRNTPIVFDINDIWPDTLAISGMMNNKLLLGAISIWCRILYYHSKKIIVLSPGFKRLLEKRGVPNKKIQVIYNWCSDKDISRIDNNLGVNVFEQKLKGKFNVVFAGNMGVGQGLDSVLDAAAILSIDFPDVQIVLIGDGTETARLKHRAKSESLINVTFLPRLPISQVGTILNLADVLLVHLIDHPLFRITIPSKIQAYLAAGRPILAGITGDAAHLIEEAGAGITCDPGDADSISKAIKALYLMPRRELYEMGRRGKTFYYENLRIKIGVEKYTEIFESVLSR